LPIEAVVTPLTLHELPVACARGAIAIDTTMKKANISR